MAALDSSSTHEVETTNLATLLAQAHSSLFFSSTVITVILPILGIISWLAVTGTKDAFSTIERFSAASVSGSMSQSTTKLIDFIYSAILVPLFMVILDYIWFSIARVSSVNKTDSSLRLGIPLKSLVAISRASYGTYNPTLLSDLNKGRSGKLKILIALLLLSALANSALSNIIAYEAFSEKVLSSLGEAGILRYLSDDIITTWFKRPSALQATLGDHGFQFDIDQQTALASQLTAMLTGPSLTNAKSRLTDGAYIGLNATSVAMSGISQNVTDLLNISGFRMTVSCEVAPPPNLLLEEDIQYTNSSIRAIALALTVNAGETYLSSTPGSPGSLNVTDLPLEFMAFGPPDSNANSSSVILGYFASSMQSSTVSPYGVVIPTNQSLVNANGNLTTRGYY